MQNLVYSDPAMDTILLAHRLYLNTDYDKYRNHVYRVFNLTLLLNGTEGENYNALAIAAAFHDIGIWTAGTFDYLEPSVTLATAYLAQNGLSHFDGLVTAIINNHHKLTTDKTNAIVEAFRKADLVDLSFGLFSFGIKRETIRELNHKFPSLGFHRFIVWQALKNTVKHPLNPLPMMKR